MSSTQYGIGVTKNRFELFDNEDEDPLEVLKIRELEKEERKKSKPNEKENKCKEPARKPKTAAVSRKGITETQNLKPLDGQKLKEDFKGLPAKTEKKLSSFEGREHFNNRRNREEFNNKHNREDRLTGDFHNREDRGERFERREGRSDRNFGVQFETAGDARGRARGGGPSRGPSRGGRGGRGGQRSTFDVRGKREYDRQSGSDKTGVKHVDKREGAGAHNWGNLKDDLAEMQNTPSNDEAVWGSDKHEETSAQVNEGTVADTEDAGLNNTDEEFKELTLDEWKALKAPRRKPTYNIRKPGEGEDQSQWKKMYALEKKKEGAEEEDYDEEEDEGGDNLQRVGRQKHVLNIDIHFKDMRGAIKGRGGRGARGGPRAAVRGPAIATEKFTPAYDSPKSVPKVDDEHDFPSLLG